LILVFLVTKFLENGIIVELGRRMDIPDMASWCACLCALYLTWKRYRQLIEQLGMEGVGVDELQTAVDKRNVHDLRKALTS
jgi:hypothetical protein